MLIELYGGNKMKIVHLCLSNFYIEGFGYQENLLPKYHKKDGHDVTIIASRFSFNKENGQPDTADAGEYINSDGIKVIRINYKYKWLGKINDKVRIYKDTYRLLEKEKPDLIFCHGIQFLDLREVVRYVKDNPSCKLVADNHADYINSATNILSKKLLHGVLWKKTIKKSLRFIDVIYGVTPNRCKFLNEVYDIPKEKIKLLVMGADSEKIAFNKKEQIRQEIRKQLSIEYDDFVIITGGKIDKEKNIHHLMEAVNKIGNSKIKLIVFGVPKKEIKPIIDELSSPLIRMIGWINSTDVYNYFLASDLAVFPGTHSVLWEQAVGTGIPSIFKKWEGMTHIDVGGNCIFVEEGTVEELMTVIMTVVKDKDKYNKMKEAAINQGIPYFSYERISRLAIRKEK